MKKKNAVKIQKPLLFIVVFLFVLITIKLSFVALSSNVDGVNLKKFANNRNTKSETILAKRGNIYDKDGNSLATVVNSYKIIAYLDANRTKNDSKPNHVVDKASTAKMLNEVLGIDYDFAMEQLSKDKYQVEFGSKGKGISESVKNRIEAMELPGISFVASQKRTYTMGSFASYIIGYAKHENNDDDSSEIVGELGIESYYNDELSGKNGKITYEADAYGYTLPSSEIITEEASNGEDIYLTIDSNIQLFAETLTRNLANNYEMDWMIFTVMDAKTGAIVASSTYPNFDPNDLNTLSSYMNPLVSYEYEPGSTMKIFSFASSIEEGKYNGEDTYYSGQIQIDSNTTIKDFNDEGWGTITYDTGFAYSSNVAASKIAIEQLGADKMKNYYNKLGFGSKTGIELANEVKGKINFKYKSELATASFGQGITVTPIQMLQALSCLTNDGTTLKPYIVSKIVNSNGEIVYEGGKEEVETVFSKTTTDYMKKLMHNVVYEGLTSNYQWQPNKTTMIGKTGTAQIASPSGGYLTGDYDYIRSFAGIFPEDDPKYIVYIATKQINTKTRSIATELTKAVDDIASYLGFENTENIIEDKIITLDNYISKEVLTTVEELKNKGLNVYTLGTGKYIINQYPLKNSKVLVGSKIFLQTNDINYYLEDMTGWSNSEVKTYLNLLGVNYNVEGYGKVIYQSVPSGTVLTNDINITVNLGN